MLRLSSITAASTIAAVFLLLSSPSASYAQATRSAQALAGADLYAKSCASCHGGDGKRGAGFVTPLWGLGAQIAKFRTAQGLFEYIQLLMPFDDPAKLNDEQKWAVTAFMLSNHGIVDADKTLGANNAAGVAIK